MAVIKEFLLQILAEQGEMDADPTARTPTFALLAEGRLEEAESAARRTVSDLEKENSEFGNNFAVVQSKNVVPKSKRTAQGEKNSTAENSTRLNLFAEALIAQGITLARLTQLEPAQVSLERARSITHNRSVR